MYLPSLPVLCGPPPPLVGVLLDLLWSTLEVVEVLIPH